MQVFRFLLDHSYPCCLEYSSITCKTHKKLTVLHIRLEIHKYLIISPINGERKMVNVTISVPEVLKSKMDKHSDVNWSKVCRGAIDTYIKLLENPIPNIKMELDEVRFGYAKGKPGLFLDLVCKNEMNTQLILDRIFFEVDFHPTPGITLSIGSSEEMRKRIIPMGKWIMIPHVEVDSDTILRVDEQLARTFQCAVLITGFFEGFREAFTINRAVKVPIDEWRRFVELVMRTEKEKMKIRKKRLSEIVVKL